MSSSPRFFKAIAAMARNRVIGANNSIPWHLPEDFRWFKQTTMGHILLMGRRTFESIGRPLPGRETVVLSRTGFQHPGVRTIASLSSLDRTGDPRDVFVCGGAEVYRQTLPFCSDLYLTLVNREVEGDAFFPPFEDRFEWVSALVERDEFRIVHYRNRAAEAPPVRAR